MIENKNKGDGKRGKSKDHKGYKRRKEEKTETKRGRLKDEGKERKG